MITGFRASTAQIMHHLLSATAAAKPQNMRDQAFDIKPEVKSAQAKTTAANGGLAPVSTPLRAVQHEQVLRALRKNTTFEQ